MAKRGVLAEYQILYNFKIPQQDRDFWKEQVEGLQPTAEALALSLKKAATPLVDWPKLAHLLDCITQAKKEIAQENLRKNQFKEKQYTGIKLPLEKRKANLERIQGMIKRATKPIETGE